MGIDINYLNFFKPNLDLTCSITNSLNMIELGDQIIDCSTLPRQTAKEYFTNLGYKHTSVDINGLHGSLIKDLRYPDQFREWHNMFDILTNFGTTEHVEPLESQYQCWTIIHDLVKPGGYFVHVVPDIDDLITHATWRGHCKFYYSKKFFETLSYKNNYDLIAVGYVRGHVCAVIKKSTNSNFNIEKQTLLNNIDIR